MNRQIAGGFVVAALLIGALAGQPSMLAAQQLTSCVEVSPGLGSCLDFVTGRLAKPSSICCGSVQRLNAMASTTIDRKTLCVCVKEAANRNGDMRDELMAALPGQCSVYLPYLLTRRTDCNRIQ